MKVAKPVKVPILTRTYEVAGQLRLGVAALLGFPLDRPRELLDEIALWQAVGVALGESGVLDEGTPKSRGELLVCGSCHAPGGVPTPATFVRVCCGPVDKRLSVLGDRRWEDGVSSDPEPFTQMPLDWRHAYGGEGYRANPFGKGHRPVGKGRKRVHPLPNVEPFDRLMRSPSERPAPAGLLPMDVTFEERRNRAGTYDRRWFETHFPGMPADMDPTFFNAAPRDQWLDGFWCGDEAVLVEHMHPDHERLEGKLPGLVTRVFVTQRSTDGEAFMEIPLQCDTVWLFPESRLGVVAFHGAWAVREDDGADIVHLLAACEEPAAPRSPEHYLRALERRLDKDHGALASLSDSDLMPEVGVGVAPNLGETDVGRWVRGEGLWRANLRRGELRDYSRAKAEVEAEGLDPADYGLAEPPAADPEPALDDLDALAQQLEQQRDRAEQESKRLDALRAEADERARELGRELGVDIDGAADGAPPCGPPSFSAADQLQMILDNLEIAREGGAPLPDLEEQVQDPDYQAGLIATECELRELYRQYGHFQPPAAPMDAEASGAARVVVQAAYDSQTSLAGRDLTGADLSGMDLGGVDLGGAFLEGADLSGCDLTGANLDQAVLARANLEGAILAGASLAGANLGEAALAGAIFDAADLSDGVLSRARLAGAKLTGAKLDGVDLLEARFGDVDLSGASLSKATFMNGDLSGARFAAADLTQATFLECTLDGADFTGANLEKTSFIACCGRAVSFRDARFAQGVIVHGSAFSDADCRGAVLERANLRGTDLRGARFDGAAMTGADLSDCDVTGGSFDRAVLTGAMLVRTKLDEATLVGVNLMDALASKSSVPGADFGGANLFRADLSRVRGDERTSFADALVTNVRYLPKAESPPGGLP
ncbi:MAG: DUF2169 domain-containing protein [Deltaproteobacteria bacterium]|jgi:uncharacterized protein YjbI with pentapeptide repeats|nr:DUF2169 domain-containing protein [Deltaproteobacteria bacterium]MBW2535831.1 DUF2169 domain-containing protein [Deltaproteobacteria bacterium]